MQRRHIVPIVVALGSLATGLALAQQPTLDAAPTDCNAKQSFKQALVCYQSELTQHWNRRSDTRKQWHRDEAENILAKGLAYALRSTVNRQDAGEALFITSQTLLLGLDGVSPKTDPRISPICARAREAIDYGCKRSYCAAPGQAILGGSVVSGTYADAASTYKHTCGSPPPRCESTACPGLWATTEVARAGDALYLARSETAKVAVAEPSVTGDKFATWEGDLATFAMQVYAETEADPSEELLQRVRQYRTEVELPNFDAAQAALIEAAIAGGAQPMPEFTGIHDIVREPRLPKCEGDCANLDAELGKYYDKVRGESEVWLAPSQE